MRARASDGQLSVPSAPSAWLVTPTSRPMEAVRNLRFKFLDSRHLLLEWDPIEEMGGSGRATGSHLRYNVSWSTSRKDKTRRFTSFETVDGTTLALRLPRIGTGEARKRKMRVRDGTRMVQLTPSSRYDVDWSGIEDESGVNGEEIGEVDDCYVLAVAIHPFNDEGVGLVSTDTVVQVTDQVGVWVIVMELN